MVLATAWHLDNVGHWARSSLLEAVLLVIGTILLTRFARWVSGRITSTIDAKADQSDALVSSEALKYRHSITQVITWTLLVVIYCVVGVLTFETLGFPLIRLRRARCGGCGGPRVRRPAGRAGHPVRLPDRD